MLTSGTKPTLIEVPLTAALLGFGKLKNIIDPGFSEDNYGSNRSALKQLKHTRWISISPFILNALVDTN